MFYIVPVLCKAAKGYSKNISLKCSGSWPGNNVFVVLSGKGVAVNSETKEAVYLKAGEALTEISSGRYKLTCLEDCSYYCIRVEGIAKVKQGSITVREVNSETVVHAQKGLRVISSVPFKVGATQVEAHTIAYLTEDKILETLGNGYLTTFRVEQHDK